MFITDKYKKNPNKVIKDEISRMYDKIIAVITIM
jgi:hypothetical protein